MRIKRKGNRLALLLLIIIAVGSGNVLPVSAGLQEVIRDTSTMKEEISSTEWNNAQGDVIAKDGVLIFPDSSISNTKLIAKIPAKVEEGVDTLAIVEGDFSFTSLPKGQKFVLAFGLSSVEGSIGEPGNVEIGFENNGGLKVSVVVYNENGEAVQLVAPRTAGNMKSTHLSATISADAKLQLTVGGTIIFHAKLPISGEGRIGFIQTGSCGVKISNLKVVSYKYNRPENSNIYEDFENGHYNKNLLTSKTVYRSYSSEPTVYGIVDMDGNKVFHFYQHNAGYLGTQMKYSNFEMAFDIPYMGRKTVLDENGKDLEYMNGQFLVAFGGEAASFSSWGYESGAEFILFREINQIQTQSGHTAAFPAGYQVFDGKHDNNKGWSAKIRVMDGNVKVFIKWMEETTWTEVISYALPTPTGTIQFWQGANMAIDNLSITNLDANPNLVEVEYKSSLIEVPEDFDYQPMKKVYREKVVEEKGFSWIILIPIVAGVCVAALGGVVLIKTIKSKKRKAGDTHE